jgi:hypothetical protein
MPMATITPTIISGTHDASFAYKRQAIPLTILQTCVHAVIGFSLTYVPPATAGCLRLPEAVGAAMTQGRPKYSSDPARKAAI